MCPENICQVVPFDWSLPTRSVFTDTSLIGCEGAPGVSESAGAVVRAGSLPPYQYAGASGHLQCFHTFADHIRETVVHILTDNTNVLYYVNKQEEACSRLLCLEVIRLWQFCIDETITLIAFHLPGFQNHLVDHPSRYFSLGHEWSLKTSVFQVIFIAWSILMRDLFASRDNRKYLFCS